MGRMAEGLTVQMDCERRCLKTYLVSRPTSSPDLACLQKYCYVMLAYIVMLTSLIVRLCVLSLSNTSPSY
ncbi:hypothetical protein BDV09DRAFT_53287 [Aspergillus tetrazonus]